MVHLLPDQPVSPITGMRHFSTDRICALSKGRAQGESMAKREKEIFVGIDFSKEKLGVAVRPSGEWITFSAENVP